jgi:hypothetical protein
MSDENDVDIVDIVKVEVRYVCSIVDQLVLEKTMVWLEHDVEQEFSDRNDIDRVSSLFLFEDISIVLNNRYTSMNVERTTIYVLEEDSRLLIVNVVHNHIWYTMDITMVCDNRSDRYVRCNPMSNMEYETISYNHNTIDMLMNVAVRWQGHKSNTNDNEDTTTIPVLDENEAVHN